MLIPLLIFVSVLSTFNSSSSGDPCQTPGGEDGNCVPITDCQPLYILFKNSLPEKASYLRKHHCGFYGQIPKVCCRSSDELPSADTCGLQIERKIFGGQVADLDEFPWMALLEYRNDNGTKYFDCGGVLISRRYVLTAGHCIKSNLVSVRLGEYNTRTEVDCFEIGPGKNVCAPKPIDILPEEKIAHENYSSIDKNQYNDIGLVRLKEEVTFSDFIKPICLPITSKSLTGKILKVAGWGHTENRTAISEVKLKVEVPIKDKSDCETIFRDYNINLNMRSSQLCVGGEKGKDSCKGDSGGPLMDVRKNRKKDTQWYVEGIVSFGFYPCGMRNWPSVYTRTSEYVTWIVSKMRP